MQIIKVLLIFALISIAGAGIIGIIALAFRLDNLFETSRKYHEWERSLDEDGEPW